MSTLFVDTVEPEGATTDLTLGASGGGDKVVIPGTIKISGGSPGAGKYLQSDADGDGSWATVAGGLTAASLWKLTATHTGNKNPIDANLAASTTAGQGVLGSAMTESSGVFTFPSTGYWHVTATFTFNRTAGDSGAGGFIKSTVNNGTDWTIIAGAYVNLLSVGTYSTASINAVLDVTDTSNNKVSFQTSHDNTSNSTVGSSAANYTCFTFMKLADT